MSDIVKALNMGIPARERLQVFTQVDAVQSDVLMIQSSLGRPAQSVSIESVGGMTVRVNVYQFNAPLRTGNDLMYTSGMPNLALGHTYKDSSQTPIQIEAGETLVLNDIPIKDIEIVTVTGNFTIVAN